MVVQHRNLRTLIRTMAPKRAAAFIQAFELPAEEEACLLLCDVKRLSYIQASDMLHISPEVVKRRRQSAFAKILDGINHTETH